MADPNGKSWDEWRGKTSEKLDSILRGVDRNSKNLEHHEEQDTRRFSEVYGKIDQLSWRVALMLGGVVLLSFLVGLDFDLFAFLRR